MKNGDIVKQKTQICDCQFEITELNEETGIFTAKFIKRDKNCKISIGIPDNDLSYGANIKDAVLVEEAKKADDK